MIAKQWLALLFAATVLTAKPQLAKKTQEKPTELPDKKVVSTLKEKYGDLVSQDWLKSITATSTKTGDIAMGALIDEDQDKSLILDTRPCKGSTVTFHHPYQKNPRGKVSCEGKTFDQVEVIQK